MTDQDPQRLKTSGGTPAEIVRALRALGRDDLDAARLARVAERLSATVGSGTSTGLLRTLTGTKSGLTGLLLGLGALGALGYALIANRAAPSVQAPAAPSVQIPAAPAPAPAPAAAQQAPAVAEPREAQPVETTAAPNPAPSQEPPRPSHAPKRAHARPRDGRVRATDSASVAAAPVETANTANELQPAPANSPEPEHPRSHTDVKPPAEEPAPKDTTPSAKPLQVAERSETSLLYEARKIASREPEAALRLLDEHTRRFPSGVLVPEREVLAIETLRRLGRDAEAERRLQRFEARYPRSIHLRRLERSAADAGD